MKKRFVFGLFLFNAAVLAAGYYYFSQYKVGPVQQELDSAQAELQTLKGQAIVAAATPAPIIIKTNAFRWDQLESTNYRQYIANLRAVGCPEITVRDIIMTDVMRLYAQRRGQYYQNGREFKFWETNEKRKLKEPQIEEREKELAEIDKELPAVLRELLGINYEREINKYFVDTDEDNRRLSFLSDDKRSQVLALRDKFEGERELVTYGLNGPLSPGDIDKLKQIDQEQEEALSGLLSQDEKDEYELSMSSTAEQLRQQLIGFNPTEAEFREIYQRQKALDDEYAYEDTNDPTVVAAKAADEDNMMNDIKSQMSPDRAAALDHTKDPDYQNLTVLAEQYDLPAGTSQTIEQMRQTAEDEKQQLLADKSIPPEQVQAALQAIQAETEKAARRALGDQAYAQYSQSAGWIHALGGN